MNDLKHLHQAYQRKYARLVEAVSQAADRADPIGLLAMACPADEYGPEVGVRRRRPDRVLPDRRG
jgi:hypothetical protein